MGTACNDEPSAGLDKQSHSDTEQAMLAEIYNSFTEGFRHRPPYSTDSTDD